MEDEGFKLQPSGKIFNGEIYNPNQLRKKLLSKHNIIFKTNSDTEVILNLLIYEGLDYVKNLDGIFAIVFYDSKTDSITLIRDPVGVKPIYYYNKNKKIYIPKENYYKGCTISYLLKTTKRQIQKSNIAINNLNKYEEILLVGSGKGVVSLSAIPEINWKSKSDLIYKEFVNLYKKIL